MSTSNLIVVLFCVAFVIFLIVGFTVPLKWHQYQEQEAFTDYRTVQEPYEVVETYIDDEPYADTVIKYRQECQSVAVQFACGSYVCGQNCRRPGPGPGPKPGPGPGPGPGHNPPSGCQPNFCTKYCTEHQIVCNDIPYTEDVTKYRQVEKQRTIVKIRDKQESFTNYRTVTKQKQVPLFY